MQQSTHFHLGSCISVPLARFAGRSPRISLCSQLQMPCPSFVLTRQVVLELPHPKSCGHSSEECKYATRKGRATPARPCPQQLPRKAETVTNAAHYESTLSVPNHLMPCHITALPRTLIAHLPLSITLCREMNHLSSASPCIFPAPMHAWKRTSTSKRPPLEGL